MCVNNEWFSNGKCLYVSMCTFFYVSLALSPRPLLFVCVFFSFSEIAEKAAITTSGKKSKPNEIEEEVKL